MRHSVSRYKLTLRNRDRQSLLMGLARSLILSQNGYIKTTIIKAKALRPFFEKLITLGKCGNLNARRRIIALMKGCADASDIAQKFIDRGVIYKQRPGGYTRIIRNSYRSGDNAEMAVIQLV